MSIEQQVQDALDDLDELLLEGRSVEDAVAEAARCNGLSPGVLRTRAERNWGDWDAHRRTLELRAAAAQREREHQDLEKKVRKEAANSAEYTYYACCLDDPELAGRPSWPICINNVIERLQITDRRLADAVSDAVYSAIRRLDRKHGTRTVHFRD